VKKWVFVLGLVLSFNVRADCAEGVDTCGECGTGCLWEKKGTDLTVIGVGENAIMEGYSYTYTTQGDYASYKTTAPWGTDITSINITGTLTNVGSYAFMGARNVTSLNIGDSVTSIGSHAFCYLNDLSGELKLPEGLISIKVQAFNGMALLTSVNIPSSVTYVGSRAFSNKTAKVYCDDSQKQCDSLLFGSVDTGLNPDKLIKYTKDGDRYVLGGVKYRTLVDMQNNIPVKRIYTIDEANAVAGKTNTFSIRYR